MEISDAKFNENSFSVISKLEYAKSPPPPKKNHYGWIRAFHSSGLSEESTEQ